MNQPTLPQTAATVFSWDLKINNQSVSVPFGNLRFSFSVNGMGTSGVSAGQFEFDLWDEYGQYSEALIEDSAAVLSCPELYFTSREYFISSRSVSKKICRFTCYDRMCKTDKTLDISGLLFDENNAISADGIISAVAHQCGFAEGYGSSGTGIETIKIKRSDVENVACRRALELISEAMCGVWTCDENNKLYLACLGGGAYGDYAFVTEYSEIDFQGKNKITALIMKNSSDGTEFNFDTGEYGTVIEIESPFACKELASEVWERLCGFVYTAWNCEKADVTHGTLKCLTSIYLERSDEKGNFLFASDTQFSVDSTGIYFSGGAPAYDVWNYKNYLERQKLSIGKNVGNTTISENGDIIFRNLNKGGGLNECDNGICLYKNNNGQQ